MRKLPPCLESQARRQSQKTVKSHAEFSEACLGVNCVVIARFRWLVLISSLISVQLAGCSVGANQRGSIADVVGASAHNLEVAATTEDQARQEVLGTPTDFDVTIDEDRYSWERTHLFLERYVDPAQAPVRPITKVVGSRWGLESPPVLGGYVYEVFREVIPNGFHYSVTCHATGGADPQQAALNAANLSRFIRDGKLELSLLPTTPSQ